MAEMVNARDLRAGNVFIRNKNLYLVIENSFNKTAMREGIVKCKVKNYRTGAITIEVLTGEKLELAMVEKNILTYSYNDGNNFVFMNNETFEQIEIANEKLKWESHFLTEGSSVKIISYNAEVLGVELPDAVAIKIEFAEDGVQGNTATTALKKARLVTGWEIQVPQFIKTGEMVLIKTIDGTYSSRA